jgi:hypothetical protein
MGSLVKFTQSLKLMVISGINKCSSTNEVVLRPEKWSELWDRLAQGKLHFSMF